MGHVNMLDIMHVCNQSFMNNTQYYYVQKLKEKPQFINYKHIYTGKIK